MSRRPSFSRVVDAQSGYYSPAGAVSSAPLSRVFTIVLMASVFDTDLPVHEKYDFKGEKDGERSGAGGGVG